MTKRKIIYIHIPKTGGSTLQGIINRTYRKSGRYKVANNREALAIDELDSFAKDKIKLIQGHMCFGLHEKFNDPDACTYITMLRDPVRRVISNYYFILTRKTHYLYDEIVSNNYTLKDYVESGIVANAENAQIRLLSNNIDVPHNECTREMLEQAKSNLDNYFSVVGINEMYDETVLFLQDEFGWKFPYYSRLNVTGHGVKQSDLDEETLAAIRQYNALDIELYEYVKSNFKKRVEEAGEPFQQRLKKYKRRNKSFVKLVKVKRGIWR